MRLLLVEDDAKLAAAVCRGLRGEGYAVDHAADGEAAIADAHVFDYDAVILDLMLPRHDGLDVCRTLRRRGVRPGRSAVNAPIRVRMTGWYVAVLALVLLAVGAFVLVRLRSDLTDATDRALRPAAAQIAAGYSAEGRQEFMDTSRTVLSG